MDKVIHSDTNITTLGGLNFIFKAIKDKELDKFLDEEIGYRGVFAKYSHSDIVLSLFGSSLAQGSYVSDIEVFREKFNNQFFCKIPSADTVEYVCTKLKTPTVKETTVKGVTHWFNYSDKMNETLVGLAVKTGMLKTGNNGYIMDFDNIVIEHDKQDAMLSYKMTKGYHPNLAFIGRIPIHMENHNGNTPARYGQHDTLKRCFDNLKKKDIKVTAFRGDSASYQKKVVEVVEANTDTFYIRLTDCESLRKQCGAVKEWTKVVINNIVKEVAAIEYQPFGEEKTYRAVVTRTERKNKQIDLLSGTAYDYYGIINNDKVKNEKEVIEFYNQRGDGENSNRYILNDFNWHHLPFPDMCTNTVFMYLMAMCTSLFEWIKTVLVANKTKGITITMRVKAICFHYITVASKFITHARKKILKIYSATTKYYVLQI